MSDAALKVTRSSRWARRLPLQPDAYTPLVEHVPTRQRSSLFLAQIFLTDGTVQIVRAVLIFVGDGERGQVVKSMLWEAVGLIGYQSLLPSFMTLPPCFCTN